MKTVLVAGISGAGIALLGVLAFETFIGLANDYRMYSRYQPYVERNRILYPIIGWIAGAVLGWIRSRKSS